MDDKTERKSAPGEYVEVVGETYDSGMPKGEEAGRWRQKLSSRAERLKYLETGERYWYSKEWYGSEKRNKPA